MFIKYYVEISNFSNRKFVGALMDRSTGKGDIVPRGLEPPNPNPDAPTLGSTFLLANI